MKSCLGAACHNSETFTLSYIGYYMFSLLQAIQGRWFSICHDEVLHVSYSRPHSWRTRTIVVEDTWRPPPAKANPAYAMPIPAWPAGKAIPAGPTPGKGFPIRAWPLGKAIPAAVPKIIPAKFGSSMPIGPAAFGGPIPAKIGSSMPIGTAAFGGPIPAKIGTYAGQPRVWLGKAKASLTKLSGPPKAKAKGVSKTPKTGWRKRPKISLQKARGTVIQRTPDEEEVSPEEWLKAKLEVDGSGWMEVVQEAEWMQNNIDVQWDEHAHVGMPADPVEDVDCLEDPYKVESDDSEDGQSISYYMNSFNTILVTFLTPPQATHPTLPRQPPLPKPNPSNPTTLTKAKSYQANHPYQSQILPSQILVRWKTNV